MNFATKALTAPFRVAAAGAKAFTMRWSASQGWWGWLLPRTRFDYAKEMGDGTGSSIIVALVNFIARSFPEAPVMVVEEQDDGLEEKVARHPMVKLLERPNPEYSGVLLWMAMLADWTTDGNGYWLKQRDRADRVARLWWAPSWTMEPKWPDDGKTYIGWYDYRPDPGRDAIPIATSEVVHFRNGLDPKNTRKGLSQLKSLWRELFTDEEAANLTASLMRNLGVPGVVISPDGFNAVKNKESASQIEDKFNSKYTGDNRGGALVMTAPTKIHTLAFSPEQMNLRDLRRVPEERAAAVLGISPMVVGFGAGLEHSSFTNMETALSAAWNQNLIPTQRLMAADLEIQLLPDFDTAPNRDVAFDHSKVRALQSDQDKLYTRLNMAVNGGWCRVDVAQRRAGLPVDAAQAVYLRQANIVPVSPDDIEVPLMRISAARRNGATAPVPVEA